MYLQGNSYLIPTDACSTATSDWLSVEYILNTLNQRRNMLFVVLLDACRGDKNPRAKSFHYRNPSGPYGPALKPKAIRTPNHAQYYIMFSCEPDHVSYDGQSPYKNSNFTRALLQHIHTPDLRIEDLFRRLARDMGHNQVPWLHQSASSRQPFYFNPYLEPDRRKSANRPARYRFAGYQSGPVELFKPAGFHRFIYSLLE